ncbi:MAG: uncharacterized protein PWP04_1690 [Candidatus Atribacteria bacterium]|nr:uncharacterized protein [Candidatus Atribacteria bacterium]
MEKISQWVAKYAWPILIVAFIITVILGYQLTQVRFEDDVTEYLPEDDPEVSFFNSLEDEFTSFQGKSLLVALDFDNLFTPENLKTLQQIVEELEKISSVKSISALTNMPKIETTQYGIEVKEVVEVLPETQAEADNLRKDLEEDELVWGKMVTPDGRGTIIAISLYDTADEFAVADEVKKAVAPFENRAKVTYFGLPIIMEQMSGDAQRTLNVLAPISGLILLAILFWGFRTVQGVVLPVFMALLASLWSLGVATLAEGSLTIVSATIPVILLALITAYGIHFVNRYYEERLKVGEKQATRITFKEMLIPIAMSAFTTMGGFISLFLADIKPITEFGLYSTLGILFGLILATFVLAAFFTIFIPRKVPVNFDHSQNNREKDGISRLLLLTGRGITHHKNFIIGILVVAFLILTIGIPQIQVETTVEAQMGEDHPLTQLLNYFQDRFGGTDYNYLYLETEKVKHPFVLREMVRICRFAEENQLFAFSDPSSIATFIMDLNQAMDGWRAIPDSEDKIHNLWFFAEGNQFIEGKINPEETAALVEFRSKETTSQQLSREIKTLETFLAERPKRIKSVSINTPGAVDHLVQTILADLKLFGLEINPQSQEKAEEIILSHIQASNEEFMPFNQEFAQAVSEDALLEIEDLGLDPNQVTDALMKYFTSPEEELMAILAESLDITEDDAFYLADILTFSMERVAQNNKIQSLKAEIEQLVGQSLSSKDYDFIFYQILDQYVFVPDEEGEISLFYRVTGTPVITNYINDQLFNQQVESMVLAFIIVFGLLLLQLRSLRKAMVAIVPVLATVYTSFGLMGLLKIPLNTATLMVASIAIGVSIDYTIHFTSRWYREIQNQSPDPLRITMVSTGRGIVLNSLAVAGGIYVLTLSSIKMISMFGLLIATVLLASVLYALLLLPLLLHVSEYTRKNNNSSKKGV